MLGRFLGKLGWHKKPVTHAAALWALVAFAAFLLIVFGVYSGKISDVTTGLVQARPAKSRPASALPSAFGKILTVEDGAITIESKQEFSRILVDDVTEVSRVGGGTFNPARLAPGMTVMATGHADGTTLTADALVVLSEEDLDTTNE